jgi:hypothetical protein
MTMLILATDMARHAEIMDSFKDKLATGFDFNSKEHMDTVRFVTSLLHKLISYQVEYAQPILTPK